LECFFFFSIIAKFEKKINKGGVMSQHKKERTKELDRERRRRKQSLKLRAKENKASNKKK
jgi:hypothetical protein